MPTASPKLPPLPAVTVPLVDPKTGLINPEWHSWLKFAETIIRTLRTEV